MLGKLLTPFTTAAPVGVATRDLIVIVGAILSTLGVLGLLDRNQVDELTKQLPALLPALGALATVGMSIYRIVFKSSSDKAAEAAKLIDAKIAPDESVVIKTPAGEPDIKVSVKK